jgi:hypothetical protein
MKAINFFAHLFVLTCVATAEPMTVSDDKGRKIDIHLLAVDDNNVTFSVKGRRGGHELTIDRFDEASQQQILEAAKALKPRLPKLDIDVVIGKRRKKGDSWYMVTQEVTSKVQIKNTSLKLSLPETKAKIVFIGRGRKTGDFYKILAAGEFELSIEPGKEFEHVCKEFSTTYDSDNRGSGNVGGYQYDSYVLALLDSEGNVIDHKTSDPSIRSLIDGHTISASTIVSYPVETLLTEEMSTTLRQ